MYCIVICISIFQFTFFNSSSCRFEVDDLYKEIAKHKALLDTSNYPKQHFLFDEQNKKIVGKMKDETAGKLIENQLLLLYIF